MGWEEPECDEYQYALENAMFAHCDTAVASMQEHLFRPGTSLALCEILAWAFREEDREARDIVHDLGLNGMHMAAILRDEEWFKAEAFQRECDYGY